MFFALLSLRCRDRRACQTTPSRRQRLTSVALQRRSEPWHSLRAPTKNLQEAKKINDNKEVVQIFLQLEINELQITEQMCQEIPTSRIDVTARRAESPNWVHFVAKVFDGCLK